MHTAQLDKATTLISNPYLPQFELRPERAVRSIIRVIDAVIEIVFENDGWPHPTVGAVIVRDDSWEWFAR